MAMHHSPKRSEESSSEEEEESEEGTNENLGLAQYFEVIRKSFALAPSPGGRQAPAENGEVPPENGEENNDLEGLVKFLEELANDSSRLIQVTYVVNRWALGGIIPMTHHGFVFKTSCGDYFSLDFSRKGIVWDVYGEEPPDLPDNTICTQSFNINADPLKVKRYCEDTKPFSWLRNDCDTWSQGLMPVVGIPAASRPRTQVCGNFVLQHEKETQVCVTSGNGAQGGQRGGQAGKTGKAGSGRRQRKDACV